MWKCMRCNKENQDSEEKCINCGHGKTMDYTGHRSVSRLRPEMTNNWKKQKEKPMLMADCIGDDEENGTVFGSFILRNDIHRIEFIRITSPIPRGAWDVSEDRSGKIWAWVNKSGEENVLQIGSENGVYANPNCRNLFWRYKSVKEIAFNNLFDSSRVTDANGMFGECINLTALNLDGFQTENVRDMAFMFLSCKALTELNVSNFNTDNAQSMTGMFKLCEMLCDLDVSNFNTSRVTEMEGMFSTCESLTSLDVSGFDTGRVKSMRSMFYECSNLKIVDISRFNTESAKDMRFMFCKCKNLTELDVSHFKTDQVETMEAMFNACYNLRRLDVSGFDTRKATNMCNMFLRCGNLEELDVSNFDTRSVENMHDMFNGCEKLERLDVGGFDTSRVTNMDGMFYECKKLERLDVGSFNTELVKDMSFMFCKCERLTEINVSHFKTDQVENMEAMFCRCGNLRKLEVSGFDTRKATNMKDMFSFCENLTQLDTSNFYYAPNVNVEGMFKECGASKDNTVPDFARKQKTLYVFNGEEMDKRENRRHYIGNSIEEICQNFLSYKDNKSINNGQGKVRNTLNISDSDKIYLIHDDSWFSRGKNGFAITDKGVYVADFGEKAEFMSWKEFRECEKVNIQGCCIRFDGKRVAYYTGGDRVRLQIEALFIAIHKYLNNRSLE